MILRSPAGDKNLTAVWFLAGPIRLHPRRCQVVTPECFNRGSTVLTTTLSNVEWSGGPVRNSSGFPLQSKADPSEALWRKKHAGMTD